MQVGIFSFAVGAVIASIVVGGCGGSGASNQGALTPRGQECPLGPPSDDQINSSNSDVRRFHGLEELSRRLLETNHPLYNSTLVGGESNESIGSHIRTIATVIANWELEKRQGNSLALRREAEGDLHNVADRVRCAADQLIKMGPTAQEKELVCWSLELWKTGRAYTRMASK
jgi:hypothetical protein